MISDCFESHVYRSYANKEKKCNQIYLHPFIQIVSARGRARSFMEELRFSYRAHSSSLSVCFTSTGENPLSSLPWSSVSEPKSAWFPWKNNPLSDQSYFGCYKIRMIWIMNPILGSPQNAPHPQISTISDCVNGERLHITLLILKPQCQYFLQ